MTNDNGFLFFKNGFEIQRLRSHTAWPVRCNSIMTRNVDDGFWWIKCGCLAFSVMTYCLRLRIVGRASIECVFSVRNAAATLHKYDMSSVFWQCCLHMVLWTTLQSRASTAYVFLLTLRYERNHGCRWIFVVSLRRIRMHTAFRPGWEVRPCEGLMRARRTPKLSGLLHPSRSIGTHSTTNVQASAH